MSTEQPQTLPAEPAPEPQATTPAAQQQVVTVHLQNIPLLSGLPPEILTQVGSAMQFRTFERGAYVLHKGSAGDHLLFLLSGRLQVVDVTEDGRELGLSFLSPGDYLGELSVIDGLPRSASVIANTPCLIAFLPRAHTLGLIYSHPLVAERILKRMATKIRTASSHRAILGIPNAFQRVFALINQLAQPGPGSMTVIETMPTQQEIAIMVNTSRETVSRALQVLIQKSIVEKDMRRLIIRQPAILKEMAVDDSSGQVNPQSHSE